MPRIRPITDLRNTNETYEAMLEERQIDAAIAEAEAEYASDSQLLDARKALSTIKEEVL